MLPDDPKNIDGFPGLRDGTLLMRHVWVWMCGVGHQRGGMDGCGCGKQKDGSRTLDARRFGFDFVCKIRQSLGFL